MGELSYTSGPVSSEDHFLKTYLDLAHSSKCYLYRKEFIYHITSETINQENHRPPTMGGWAAGKGNFSYQTHSEW